MNYHDQKIVLGFSEYVDIRSFSESVFLSPDPGRLRYDWNGEEVEIHFDDPLRDQTTYILTLGTDLKDARNNSLTEAYSLSFSTGDRIDSGKISGRVFDENSKGVLIFAYLRSAAQDTLDPTRVKPDFLTQTGTDGSFRLQHLPWGTYRIMAVRDVFKNHIYDVQSDDYGMPRSDVAISTDHPEASGMNFRLTRQDTVAPFLSSAKALDRNHVLLRFNEAADPADLDPQGLEVVDTAGRSALPVLDVTLTDTSGKEAQITTGTHDSAATYRVTVLRLTDLAGNHARPGTNSAIFSGGQTPDTIKPVMVASIGSDSMKNFYPADGIGFTFSEPVDTASFSGGLSLYDSGNQRIAGRTRWKGSMNVQFVPEADFGLGSWYTLRIVLDSLRDHTGNTFHDTVLVRHFQVIEEKSLGSIEGVTKISGPDQVFVPGSTGSVHIMARNVARQTEESIEVAVRPEDKFELGRLREGRYALWAFLDTDGDGGYGFGAPYPVRFSETFTVYPETLKIRPRWPIEGVVISLTR